MAEELTLCSTCLYYKMPNGGQTHGWCEYARRGANVRDPVNLPMPPDGSCGVWKTARRDWLFVGCEGGHDFQSIGGCNASCHADCACSVPVNECTRCGDCDYGENEEAAQVRASCAALWGTPDERFAVLGNEGE